MTHHQPKGSMCMSCSNASAACAQLPFGSMPVIQAYPDGVKAVKCAGHQPTRAERDRPAALRASEEARTAKFRELAAQPADPKLPRSCIHCHAGAPGHLDEGESPPCGCP